MKSVQRKFGTFMKRSENDADVGAVINDFRAVDDMLDRLIKDLTAWRNAWDDILKYQYDTSEAFVSLYKSIDAAADASERRHRDEQTPDAYMQKCLGLQKEYSEEKSDLAQEIEIISKKLLYPAEEAKQRTKLLHKTLKHRENTKLDYERYLSRVEHARKKETRTPKEEMNLQTQEASMQQAKIDYHSADEHVKQTLPPVTAAVLSLLPPLLEGQIRVHTTLVGQLYTVLDEYTRSYGLPNPAPPDAEIVRAFDSEFTQLRKELESGISTIARGKTAHMNMALPPEKDKSTVTGLGLRNKVMTKRETKPTGLPSSRNTSTTFGQDAIEAAPGETPDELAPPQPPRPRQPSPSPSQTMGLVTKSRLASASSIPTNGTYSSTSDPKSPPPYDYKPTALTPGLYPTQSFDSQISGISTPPSRYQTPANGLSPLITPHSALPPPPASSADYFGGSSGGANGTTNPLRRPSQPSLASAAAAAVVAKKKPPPPVPAKRMPSMQAQFVTALYDFEGQNAGDLAFREGDRIKVVKKTESQDDWWEGELRGSRGAFPANYVQV